VWNYGEGVVRVDTPRAQGAVGFLARAGTIKLKDVTIDCGNEFASAIVISLDGEPLAASRKILVQVVTEDKPYGFTTAGGKIVALGGEPFNVRTSGRSTPLSR